MPPLLPAVKIPTTFTERFLWTRGSDASALTDIPPTHHFPEEMVQEIQAAAACAFEHTVLKDKAGDPIVQSITLFCPHDGGNPFVDSMVKLIASQQNADVLVLDALELACVQFGAVGEEVGGVIRSLYDAARTSSSSAGDDKIQYYIDALINLFATRNSTGDEDTVPTSRRIIYLKDFGSIMRVAQPLLSFILCSIQKLNRTNGGFSTRPSSTILVFGIAAGSTLISGNSPHTDWHDALRAGGQTLARIMSPAHSFPIMEKEEPSCSRLCPLSAQFFLPQAYTSSDLSSSHLCKRSRFFPSDPICHEVIFSVFPQNAHSKESRNLQRVSIRERTKDVNEALLRLSIGNQGGFMDGRLSDTVFEGSANSRDHFQSSIMSPPTADMIAITVIGLVNEGPSGSSTSKPSSLVRISPSQIVKAYELHLKNLQVRKNWTVEEEKSTGQSREWYKNIVDLVMKDDLSEYENQLLGSIVIPEMLTITFDDVCAEPTVVETLRDMVSLPLLFPEQFGHGILARHGLGGILLYGPPGTGKTTLCRALAYECGAQMLIINPSDILDKRVGESEKLTEALFSLARRLSPSIIFIDHIDTFFGERSDESNIVTEFLQEMDGFSSAATNREQRVVVIGATNRPFDLDPAILRRLPRRMMIGLPGKDERKSILKIHLKGETLSDDVNLDEVANVTDEYSGSDLKDLCVSAAMAALKEAIGTPDWKSLRRYSHLDSGSEPRVDGSEPPEPPSVEKEEGNKSLPNSSDTLTGLESELDSPPSLRVVTKAHIMQALEDIRPSFSDKAQAEMCRWQTHQGRERLGKNTRNRIGKEPRFCT